MLDQDSEMQSFCKEHATQIQDTRDLLLTTLRSFMDKVATIALPEREMRKVAPHVEKGDLVAATQSLRGMAVWFVAARQSAAYWAMIDSLNFLQDATGTRWPYMQKSGRANYLAWANEHAQQVLKIIDCDTTVQNG